MNYEIAYYSLSGNTEKLAYGIAKRLPENQAFLTNLQEEYKRLIERKIEPFLPDECDYCGILLCRGQIAEEVLSKIQRQFAQQPDDPAIKKMISEAKLSEGHPDETDAENAVRFIREKLDSF